MDRNPIDVLAVSALPVALRKESVDRNLNRRFRTINHSRRSPQGERG